MFVCMEKQRSVRAFGVLRRLVLGRALGHAQDRIWEQSWYHTTSPPSYRNRIGLLLLMTSGCLCTLGIRPRPIALRMAFAIFRWFFGRSPVSLECFMRPVSVMYSDIMVKFCPRLAIHPAIRPLTTHLVLVDGVDAQHVEGVALRLLAAPLPLLLLEAGQVDGRVDVAGLPAAEDLALELALLVRLVELARLVRAVDEGLSGDGRGEGAAGALGSGGGACGRAVGEDVEEVGRVVCGCSAKGSGVLRRAGRGRRTLLLGMGACGEAAQALSVAGDWRAEGYAYS